MTDASMIESIRDFLAQKKLVLFGMSRFGMKWGNNAYRDLTSKGYTVYPVHPSMKEIHGVKCWPDLDSLPEQVDGAVIVIPPLKTEKVVEDLAAGGIKRVWMQPGAESRKAIHFCREHGISVIYKKCIMVLS